jgi:NRAMP (natural resistance-associated macrophage protein)-like metal ion transporter
MTRGGWIEELGPGLITGAADDDPSGIATYSQAGAQFGYQLAWTIVLTYPLMAGIQLVSAALGRVTGEGLSANIRARFPSPIVYGIVLLLLVANTINIAADVAAMGEALRLVVGGSAQIYTMLLGGLSLGLEVFVSYRKYTRLLKWLTLALLCYAAVLFSVHIEWREVIAGTLWPHLSMGKDTVTVVVAVFGTTISPYLFFWQAAQEVEELKAKPGGGPLRRMVRGAARHLRRIRIDTFVGMAFSNAIAWCIVVSTAATLHRAGVTHIDSAAQAAEALRPIAGNLTFAIFSLGIIGTGLLAVPVLAGSAAYATVEALRWRGGLDLKLRQARRFYGIIAAATLGGALIGITKIDPMKALFWSAVINGVVAPPIMAVMMLLARSRRVMGNHVVSAWIAALGWIATLVMAASVVAMLAM